MKPWLFMLAVLSLTACSPADQKVRSVKERLDAGEVVEFTQPGYRRPSCREGAPDWRDYRVANDDERMRIVVRKQASGLNAGPHSCFRVGGEVFINSKGNKGTPDLGVARVTKLSLVKIDNLRKNNLQGKYFASDDAFFKYKDDMKFRLKPDHQGIVTILDFDYVSSSAVDEKELIQKDVEQSTGDAFEETKNNGDSISKCSKPWLDVVVPEAEYQQAILSGKLRSYYNWGERNCLTQGQEANIRAALGESVPVLGKVKIAKIKKFRAAYVDPKYFAPGQFDLVKLKTKIQLENKSEFVTVMDFEVEGGERAQEVKTPGGVHLGFRLTQDAVADGIATFQAMVYGKPELRAGDLAQLRFIKNPETMTFEDIAVRVLSVDTATNESNTIVVVQRIQALNGVVQ